MIQDVHVFFPLDAIYFQNIGIRRVKSKKVCHLEPLPEDLPRPADLQNELQMVCVKVIGKPTQTRDKDHYFGTTRVKIRNEICPYYYLLLKLGVSSANRLPMMFENSHLKPLTSKI